MKVIQCLHQWFPSRPNENAQLLYNNAAQMLTQIQVWNNKREQHLQLVGRGYSGMQMITAIQMVDPSMNFHPIVIRKPGESGTSTANNYSQQPIIVIDDDIIGGSTIKAIADHLSVMYTHYDLVNKVKVVAATCYYDDELNVEATGALIKATFPSCELWIR